MKKILIPIFVVLLLIFFYVYYTSSAGQSKLLVSQGSDGGAGTEVVGAEIITLVEKLNGVKLDTELFKKETFQSLQDFSITLRPQQVGRPNPFAPIGQDAQASMVNPTTAPSSSVSGATSQSSAVEEFPDASSDSSSDSGTDSFDDSQ